MAAELARFPSVHRGAGAEPFAYDPAANNWRVLEPMKGPRGSAGAATVDGKIHVIGGRDLDARVSSAVNGSARRRDFCGEAIMVAQRLQRCALVAQLDRASDFESEGRRFESVRARQ